jgi:hypothetical protein
MKPCIISDNQKDLFWCPSTRLAVAVGVEPTSSVLTAQRLAGISLRYNKQGVVAPWGMITTSFHFVFLKNFVLFKPLKDI